MKRNQIYFYTIFFLALIVAWSPSKVIPYVIPLISILLLLFLPIKKIYLRLIVLFLFFIMWIFLSFIFNDEFVFQNVILFVVTYSFIIPVIVFPTKSLVWDNLYNNIVRIISIVVLIEALIGIFQAGANYFQTNTLDLNSGDVVEGTIDIDLENAVGFETPSYASNLIFSLFFLLPSVKKFKVSIPSVAIVIGSIALLLASVMHLLIFCLISIFLSIVIQFGSQIISKKIFVLLVFINIFIIFAYLVMPTNVRVLLPKQINMVKSNPKIILLNRLIDSVKEEPQIFITGLGPGQGFSRAAMISTGEYLQFDLQNLGLKKTYTTYFYKNIGDLWIEFGNKGSTLRPFSSWLALLSEFGILFSILLLIIFVFLIYQIKILGTRNSNLINIFSLQASLFFLFFIGFQEFYWEYPQAIFLGIILIKVMYSTIFGEYKIDEKLFCTIKA